MKVLTVFAIIAQVPPPESSALTTKDYIIDEYHVAISPLVAGRGPTFLAGLQREMSISLLDLKQLRSGVVIHRYGFGIKAPNA